jgi:hypothetical protein
MVGWRLGLVFVIAAVALRAAPVLAQTDEELQALRKLFAEAVEDQKAGHADVACEKLRRIQKVRDTVNIRYRLGICQEALGHLAGALASYEGALLLAGQDPEHKDVVAQSKQQIAALSKRVSKLYFAMPSDVREVTIRIDDAILPGLGVHGPIPVDPGSHTISIALNGGSEVRTTVDLNEGEQATVPVTLPVAAPRTDPKEKETKIARSPKVEDSTEVRTLATPERPIPPSSSWRLRKPVAWATVGAGGLLTAAAVVLISVRFADDKALERRCPGGRCPPGENLDEIDSIRTRANVEGPLGIAFGIAGLAGLGTGIYMLTKPEHPTAPAQGIRVTPAVSRGGGTLTLSGTF